MTATGYAQQRVQRRRDLDGAAAGGDDTGEPLMDVEYTFETLTLSLEEGVQHGCRDVSQRRAVREGDHGQGHSVGRGDQFCGELIGPVEPDGDPGDLCGVESGDEPLPLLTGGDERGRCRDDQLVSTDTTKVLGSRQQPGPTNAPAHPAGSGGNVAVAERKGRDNGTDIKASPHPTTLSRWRPFVRHTARAASVSVITTSPSPPASCVTAHVSATGAVTQNEDPGAAAPSYWLPRIGRW